MGTTLEKVAKPVQSIALPKLKTERAKSAVPVALRTQQAADDPKSPPAVGEQFSLHQGILQATAYLQTDGSFLVQAGSQAANSAASSLVPAGIMLRQTLLETGVLVAKADHLVFATDYLFASANVAAAVIVARSVNAQITWKHTTGKQVRDFYKK